MAANQLKNATVNQKDSVGVGGVFKKRCKQGQWQQGWRASNGNEGNGVGDVNDANFNKSGGMQKMPLQPLSFSREVEYDSTVRIPTRNLYAVTQHLLTIRNFIFLNSPRGFRRSLEERSHNFNLNLFVNPN